MKYILMVLSMGVSSLYAMDQLGDEQKNKSAGHVSQNVIMDDEISPSSASMYVSNIEDASEEENADTSVNPTWSGMPDEILINIGLYATSSDHEQENDNTFMRLLLLDKRMNRIAQDSAFDPQKKYRDEQKSIFYKNLLAMTEEFTGNVQKPLLSNGMSMTAASLQPLVVWLEKVSLTFPSRILQGQKDRNDVKELRQKLEFVCKYTLCMGTFFAQKNFYGDAFNENQDISTLADVFEKAHFLFTGKPYTYNFKAQCQGLMVLN